MKERDRHVNPLREMQKELAAAKQRITELGAAISEHKRLYELRGKALLHPCLRCGYVPQVVGTVDAKALEGKE